MWAHYAEKHFGVCLGFDVGELNGEAIASAVSYHPQRLRFEVDHDDSLLGIDDKFVQALLFTKAHEWSYEREYRVTVNLEHRDESTGHYYVDFSPLLQLREVILGARNEMPVGQMAKLVRGNAAPVQIFKARAAPQEFAMVRNKAVKAINVPSRS